MLQGSRDPAKGLLVLPQGLVSVGKSLKTIIDFPATAASHIICDRICHDLSVDNPVINAISNSVFPTLAFEYYSALVAYISIVRISSLEQRQFTSGEKSRNLDCPACCLHQRS